MSDRMEIKITAANGTTQVFRAVASDAQRMGDTVEQAGKRGSRSMQDWGSAAQKLGGALGALTAASLLVSGEAEASQARLETAFQNAGLAVDDYRAQIEQLQETGLDLAFDDEDVSDSLARLVGATGDYEAAVADLVIAQDLARSRQISLAEATNTILAVEAGRFRSLAQMGIVLDETATKEEALLAVQQRVSGSAEAFAETGAADFQRWQNTAENALESVGSHLQAVQGPLLALSAGTTIFGTVGGALKDMGAGAKLASLAMGPAGLVAAAGLAAGGLVLLAKHIDSTKLSASEAAEGIENFNALISELGASGATVDLTSRLAGFVDGLEWLAVGTANATAQLGPLRDELDRLQYDLTSATVNPDVTQDTIAGYEAQIAAIKEQIAVMESAEIAEGDFTDAQRILADLVQRTGQINYPILIARLQELEDELKAGTITADEYVWNLRYLEENAATYGVTLEELAAQQRGATESAERFFAAQSKLAEVTGPAIQGTESQTAATTKLGEVMGEAEAQSTRAALAGIEYRTQTELAAFAVHAAAVAEEHRAETTAQSAVTLDAIAEAMRGGTQAAILNTEAIQAYADALGQMPAGETFGERLAQRAGAAGAALGDAFRTGVGNVGDLGGQSAQVAKWALELSNVEDGYSEIQQLFDEGRISAEEYNAAIWAGNVIQSENAEIQRHVLDIQATQAPVLANLAAEQERYLEHIARQPAELQAVALAYLDNETSAKALEAAQLAAAAASGELGVAGTEMASKMIEGAAMADPYLKALLVDMGLISIGADGTITVNFDSVEGAGASLDDVVDSLDKLSTVLATAFSILIYDQDVTQGTANVEALATAAENLDGTNATITIDGNATAAASMAAGVSQLDAALALLDGSSATTTIVTNHVTTGNLSPLVGGLHGGVMGYADGGVVARMAEAGPELLRFRDGGMGLALTDGLYGVPRGTYVTPAPETKRQLGNGSDGGIHLHNPTINVYPATGDVQREFTAALVGDWRA